MKKQAFIRGIFLLCLLLVQYTVSYGNVENRDSLLRVRESRLIKLSGRTFPLCDVQTPASEVNNLLVRPAAHPASDSIPATIYNQIAERKRILAKDTLLTADLFWVLQPYLRWWRHIDPHFRVDEPVYIDGDLKTHLAYKQLFAPGLLLLNINDTLIVNQTVDPRFKSGDQILAINKIAASEYMKYTYDDRFVSPLFLLRNHYFNLVRDFTISLIRNGVQMEVEAHGMPYLDIDFQFIKQREFYTQTFPEAKAGYMVIDQFYPNNNVLIKKLRKAILDAKKQGCNSFILDLRCNSGGNGHAFDKLLSIFIDKQVVPYMKSQKLRVSEHTLQNYDFLTANMLGQLVEVPKQYITQKITLNPKMFISGMQYYVLMSKDTGSVAASFCNIMQYNAAAKLAGEPLLHNALMYGEEIEGKALLPSLIAIASLSTMQFDEFTKAVDSILAPDLPISYVATDYLSGEDGVLAKLLKIIKSNLEN